MSVIDEVRRLTDPRQNPELARVMMAVGEDIADKAAAAAPRSDNPGRNGHGADSIRAEWGTMRTGEATVNVSWDKDHFYMSFHEFGTRYIRPKMFLLGAVRTYG